MTLEMWIGPSRSMTPASTLGGVGQRALVALDDVQALDVDPVLLGLDAQDLAGLAAVLAADDDDLVVAPDLQAPMSEHLRRERDDLHVVAVAQLAGHRPEDARAARVAAASMITAAFSSKAM